MFVCFFCLFFSPHLFCKADRANRRHFSCHSPPPFLACPITGMEPRLTRVNHRSRVTPNSLQGFYLSCFTQMFGNTDAKRDWFKTNRSILILSAYVCVCVFNLCLVCVRACVCVYWRMQKHYSDAEVHDHLSQDLFKKSCMLYKYLNIHTHNTIIKI